MGSVISGWAGGEHRGWVRSVKSHPDFTVQVREVADPGIGGVFGEGCRCLLKPVPVSHLSLESRVLDTAAHEMGRGAKRRRPR